MLNLAIVIFLKKQQKDRIQRIFQITDKLAQIGHKVDPEKIIKDSGAGSVGRPHVAKELVNLGITKTIQEGFTRFLHDDGPAFIPSGHLGLSKGLSVARDGNTFASLAHPHTLGNKAENIISKCLQQGLEGIEAFYGSYRKKDRRRWLTMAKKLRLIPTGGSDFHGEYTPQINHLGINLPRKYATTLCNRLEIKL